MAPLPLPLVVLSAALRRGNEPYWGVEKWNTVEKRRARNKQARKSRRTNRKR